MVSCTPPGFPSGECTLPAVRAAVPRDRWRKSRHGTLEQEGGVPGRVLGVAPAEHGDGQRRQPRPQGNADGGRAQDSQGSAGVDAQAAPPETLPAQEQERGVEQVQLDGHDLGVGRGGSGCLEWAQQKGMGARPGLGAGASTACVRAGSATCQASMQVAHAAVSARRQGPRRRFAGPPPAPPAILAHSVRLGRQRPCAEQVQSKGQRPGHHLRRCKGGRSAEIIVPGSLAIACTRTSEAPSPNRDGTRPPSSHQTDEERHPLQCRPALLCVLSRAIWLPATSPPTPPRAPAQYWEPGTMVTKHLQAASLIAACYRHTFKNNAIDRYSIAGLHHLPG